MLHFVYQLESRCRRQLKNYGWSTYSRMRMYLPGVKDNQNITLQQRMYIYIYKRMDSDVRRQVTILVSSFGNNGISAFYKSQINRVKSDTISRFSQNKFHTLKLFWWHYVYWLENGKCLFCRDKNFFNRWQCEKKHVFLHHLSESDVCAFTVSPKLLKDNLWSVSVQKEVESLHYSCIP